MRSILVLLSLLWAALTIAQPVGERVVFPLETPGITFPREAPTPVEMRPIGRPLWTRHLYSHEITDYVRRVASDVPSRVQAFSHGSSHQGKPLVHAIISSPANLARLDEIRDANRRIFEQPGAVTDAELERMPLILWMGYGVHGNEASVCESALWTLYYLAYGQGEPIDKILENTIVILVPNFNPDGRDRFASWTNNNRGMNPSADTQDRERLEPWPGGRTNHYWFDLNRDWLPLTQPESIGRHAVWVNWRPQLTLDYHEMGSTLTYFFPPGVADRLNPLTPRENVALTEALSKDYARAFDQIGELYFTGERFDDFYPGKGSTYPDLAGSLGILFEQGGSRSAIINTPRRTLTFATTIRNQVATAVASLESGVTLRTRLLRYQRDTFREGLEKGAGAKYEALRFPADYSGTRLAHVLSAHGITVRMDDQRRFVVPARQPLARLVRSIFDRVTEFESGLFYDISAWNLDLALGVQTEFLNRVPETPDAFGITGEGISLLTLNEPSIGAILSNQSPNFFTQLQLIHNSGIQTFLVRKPVGQARPGDIFIPAVQPNHNRAQIAESLNAIGGNFVQIEGGTGEVVSFGGDGAVLLSAPRVALIVGSGTDSNNTGEIWHLLDTEWGISVSLLDADRIATADLTRYNTIILAGGSYPTTALEPLRAWMERGGRLICSTSAVDWAVRSELWTLTALRHTPNLANLPYDQISRESGRHAIPGTILEARFDTSHPLAFGIPERLPVFREGGTLYRLPETPGTVVARYTDDPVLSGYLSPEVKALAKGSASVLARRQGSGSLILILDNPNFRAYFKTGNRILGNAVFWGTSF